MDSGLGDGPIVWRAADGAEVVLSGGRPVTGWTLADGRWTAPAPAGYQGGQLFINGVRGQRPRWPVDGYAWVTADVPPTRDMEGRSSDRFEFAAGDLRADWANRADLDLNFFHTWTSSRLKLADLDETTRAATLTGPSFNQRWAPIGRGTRYLVENVRELFGVSGNWYFDRPTNELWVVPGAADGPDGPAVVAPVLESIVELRGDPDAGEHVWHLRFEGLTFAHTAWQPPPTGHSQAQAEASLPAAVRCVGARHVTFDGCRVTRTAGYAFEFGPGSQYSTVERCELTDLGGGGVKLGTERTDDAARLATGMVVRDNLINGAGRVQPGAVGVWLGYGRDCEIAHNEIADLYYSGISMGWSWGYAATPNRDNRVIANHIHDCPRGVLGDQAAIYTLGLSPGSVIRGNLIHDLVGYPWAVGIYLDEGSSDILVEQNVVYDVTTHSFNINYGRDNVVRNNVFGPILGPTEPAISIVQPQEHRSMTFTNNVVVYDVGDLLRGAWPTAQALLAGNLYFNRAGLPVDFGGQDFEAWQASGQDAGSRIADPGFGAGFSGQPPAGSPALEVGFVPFDISGAGRLTPGRAATVGPLDWPLAGPAPALPLVEGFETTVLGGRPAVGFIYEDGPAAPAAVSDEAAATGRQSLKFTDAAGQPNFYNPHYCFDPGASEGTADLSFALRLEAGSPFEHGWRSAGEPFIVGPSLQWTADGTLRAADRDLLQVPAGEFVTYRVTCALGAAADGTWSLEVTLPGQAPQRFDGLPCDPAFDEFRWCGWVSVAEAPATAYLDDLRLEWR